ncbi:MAG TPA: DUF4215 domain-containing protein, partial [Polyangiaceae bacterium]|nr:DUF4215 domain-containing protein [Polyangiaceae bacterium]
MRSSLRWLAALSALCAVAITVPFSGCGGSGVSPRDAGADSTRPSVCGDGVVETGEDCDLGSANGPPPCKSDCTWFCIPGTLNGDALCAPKDSCGGTSSCGPMHTCTTATPLADGTSCGKDAGFLCVKQVCAPAQCGDGFTTPPEECDLGSSNGKGMGCDVNCKFDCVSSDPARNCGSTNQCFGAGVCDDTKHACSGGMPKADGTACGTGQICKGGTCISPNCGDGVVEPGEQCDFGSSNGIGVGCETDCTFSCTLTPDSCITPDLCAGTNACVAFMKGGSLGQHCVVGPPPTAGTACPVGGTCTGQLCVTPNCGNGTVDPGEECDFGSAGNMHGSGCEPDCTFSCASTPNSPNVCSGADVCSAAPQVCTMVNGPSGGAGKKCAAGPVLAQCASCGGKDICVGNVCKGSTCGDGCVVAPETCDPPGPGCDAKCQKVVCGDGVRSDSEQCDDGNTANLDGCDSNCMFEQEQRVTALVLSGSTDSFCTVNALGAQAITPPGLGQIQAGITTDVASAVTNIIFKFMRPSGQSTMDLSGTTGPVVLGSLSG